MNRISLLAVAMCSLTFAACGGGDDGGKDGVTLPDARSNIDAAGAADASMDAAPVTTPSEGIGKTCNPQMASNGCPASAPQCAALSAGATAGFCTAACGTSMDMTMPPANGSAMCAAVMPASPSGRPICALYSPSMTAGTFNWSCALACGMVQGMDLGNCPTGLTCTQNFCQP